MVEFTPIIIFMAVLTAVPIQFILSPSSTSDIRYHLFNLKKSLARFFRAFNRTEEVLDDTVEAKDTDEEKKYFAASLLPRDPRPPYIKFRVGDVIKHRIHGYRGVIIGWDEKAVAPQTWLEKTHKGHKEWSEMPNYSIIIDTRDRLIPQLAYVVQENIEMSEGKIFHPLIKHYFESFKGSRYISRPWHRKVYPND